jgi:hypothetical protein
VFPQLGDRLVVIEAELSELKERLAQAGVPPP